jgi:hypothetical protein
VNRALHVSRPDSIHFNFTALAPCLAPFTKLRTLYLTRFILNTGETIHWPQPTWTLTSLRLYLDGPGLSAADLDWFTATSRTSLRHLSVSVCGRDALTNLAAWGNGLISLRTSSEEPRELLPVLVELAQMKALDWLELIEGDDESEDLGAVAAEVNRAVGREVVAVV